MVKTILGSLVRPGRERRQDGLTDRTTHMPYVALVDISLVRPRCGWRIIKDRCRISIQGPVLGVSLRCSNPVSLWPI